MSSALREGRQAVMGTLGRTGDIKSEAPASLHCVTAKITDKDKRQGDPVPSCGGTGHGASRGPLPARGFVALSLVLHFHSLSVSSSKEGCRAPLSVLLLSAKQLCTSGL